MRSKSSLQVSPNVWLFSGALEASTTIGLNGVGLEKTKSNRINMGVEQGPVFLCNQAGPSFNVSESESKPIDFGCYRVLYLLFFGTR